MTAEPATIPWRPSLGLRAVDALHRLRGRRLCWAALAFGMGVGGYFGLPAEPPPIMAGGLTVGAAFLLVLAWLGRHGPGLLALLAAMAVLGGLAAQQRALSVAGPVLGFRYYGPVEGRVVAIDRSSAGAVRLTLAQVRLDRVAPHETPRRVRLSLYGEGGVAPLPGMRVMTTAHLSPPAGPTEPGGFDFQRHAWFLSLGGVGYTRVPLLLADTTREGAPVAALRHALAQSFRAALPGERGQVAAAIVVGDRSGIPDDVTEALRASNLAHLLAISGLHMGLLVGFVFASVRAALALSPHLTLNYPTRAWAAAVALPVAAGYLAISGGGIATQRAFVMAAVMLGAIMLGRRAVSMRSVALAALIVLAWRPESLTGPGFQMSFAATGALVLAFGWLGRGDPKWRRGVLGWGIALILSSAVAGVATAPFAAIHFNRVGQYGLLANLMAVPVMGALVMPCLLAGLILWPVGLEGIPFWLAGQGIAWIIWVAEWIAQLDGSVLHLPAPPGAVLPLFGLGFAWIGASLGRGRWVGVVPCLAASWFWAQADRPTLLISESGGLVGVTSEAGRWLSREKGDGFTARSWLENDGDPVPQEVAAARRMPEVAGLPPVVIERSKRRLPGAVAGCAPADWIVTSQAWDGDAPACVLIDARALRRTGAMAVRVGEDGAPVVQTAREVQGERLWVP